MSKSKVCGHFLYLNGKCVYRVIFLPEPNEIQIDDIIFILNTDKSGITYRVYEEKQNENNNRNNSKI